MDINTNYDLNLIYGRINLTKKLELDALFKNWNDRLEQLFVLTWILILARLCADQRYSLVVTFIIIKAMNNYYGYLWTWEELFPFFTKKTYNQILFTTPAA